MHTALIKHDRGTYLYLLLLVGVASGGCRCICQGCLQARHLLHQRRMLASQTPLLQLPQPLCVGLLRLPRLLRLLVCLLLLLLASQCACRPKVLSCCSHGRPFLPCLAEQRCQHATLHKQPGHQRPSNVIRCRCRSRSLPLPQPLPQLTCLPGTCCSPGLLCCHSALQPCQPGVSAIQLHRLLLHLQTEEMARKRDAP
jgi:hypothetical protein